MEKAFCCAPDFPVVQTNYGPVRGYRFREISSFKGIPYGRAVRFHAHHVCIEIADCVMRAFVSPYA